MQVRLLFLLLAVVCLSAVAPAQLAPSLPDAPHVVAMNLPPESVPPAPDLSSVVQRALTIPSPSPMLIVATPPERPKKIVDRKFLALGILTFALTAMDVEMTQHCLKEKTCYEMNPTLPNSRAGQYAINTLTNSAVMYFSYRRRKSGKWGWWVAPVIDMGAHGVGIGTNIRFLK